MTVRVVAQIATLDELHEILDGWQEAMAGDDGAGMARRRGCGRPGWPRDGESHAGCRPRLSATGEQRRLRLRALPGGNRVGAARSPAGRSG